MNTSGHIKPRRVSHVTSALFFALLVIGPSLVYFAEQHSRLPFADATAAEAAAPTRGSEIAAEIGGDEQAAPDELDSSAALADIPPHLADGGCSSESPASGASNDAPPVAAVPRASSEAPISAAVAALPAAAKKPAPVVAVAFKPGRIPDESGVIFVGQSDLIAKVKAHMSSLLGQMGWTANQVLTRESPGGERIAYMLNSAPGDTNTFVLSRQPQLGLGPEMITYTSRLDQKKTLALVSQKEILAAMLQRGRAFIFSGARCQVEALKEQLALRQNVVYWGLRADWVFPEDKVYRYNTGDYWQVMRGDDWTLKPGIRPSQAIADAFVGRFSYQIGCTSACRFIFTHGILDFYRAVQPNPSAQSRLEQVLDPRRPFADIAPTVDRNRAVVKEGRLMERHTDVPWNHWVPGDWGWIRNPDDKSAEELGSEGCNIIYAGGGFFVNYYPERPPKTLEQAIKRVYGWRFGLDESELDLPADLLDQLYQDPRSGGMLRDVRDYPRQFGIAGPAQPGA